MLMFHSLNRNASRSCGMLPKSSNIRWRAERIALPLVAMITVFANIRVFQAFAYIARLPLPPCSSKLFSMRGILSLSKDETEFLGAF